MSAQFRSGGGGGMQTVGYDAAHFPPRGGGGGGAEARPQRPLKLTTGWSSMPFGATPVWPWIWSKKPTPEIVAVPLSLLNELDGRAARGDQRVSRVAHLQSGPRRCARRARHQWELGDHRRAGSGRIGDHEMDVAVGLELHLDELRRHAERRPLDSSTAPQAEIAGNRRATQRADRRRLRAESERAAGRVGERLHRPALDAAADLLRARRGRLRRRETGPGEGNDRQAEEGECQPGAS